MRQYRQDVTSAEEAACRADEAAYRRSISRHNAWRMDASADDFAETRHDAASEKAAYHRSVTRHNAWRN